ncbi:MAG: hypothetical protein ACLFTT_03525 [Candidatus Hydrogenedentota bacterium]
MRRIQPLSRAAAPGSAIAPEVKLTFWRDLIDISLPLFINKDPNNSIDDGGSNDTNDTL